MQTSVLAKQGAAGRGALSKNVKPTATSTRSARSRSTVVTRAMMDQSSLEVSAALTALIASGAAVLSLASVIRQANGFDTRDKVFKASTITTTTVPAPVTVQQIVAEKTEEPVVKKEAQIEVAEVVAVQKEVAPTPVVVAATATPVMKVEAKKAEQKPIAATSTTPVVTATAAPAIKKVEKKVDEVITPIMDSKPANVKVGEPIVFNFENNDNPEAISMSSQDDDVTTTRVTEPTLPKADPVAADAVLEAMTADAPVGITVPGSNGGSGTATTTPPKEEPVLELVGVMAAPTSAAEAMEAAREYEARLARVLADAKMETATVAASETATADKQQRSQRLVTITEQYQEKIDALWASYEVKKVQEAVLLSKQEKLTMDLAALDAAQQAQQEAALAENKMAMVGQKIMAALAAIWAFIMALVAKVTGGRFGNTPAGASA